MRALRGELHGFIFPQHEIVKIPYQFRQFIIRYNKLMMKGIWYVFIFRNIFPHPSFLLLPEFLAPEKNNQKNMLYAYAGKMPSSG